MTLKEKILRLIELSQTHKIIQRGLYNGASVSNLFSEYLMWDVIPVFDYINVTSLTKLCYTNMRVTKLELKNTHNATAFTTMCTRCTALKSVINIDFSSAETLNNPFSYCSALEELEVVGEIPVKFDLKYSPLLNVESAKNVIMHLKNYSGTEYEHKYAITFAEEVWAALDAEGDTAPHGGTWKDYVFTVLSWNY